MARIQSGHHDTSQYTGTPMLFLFYNTTPLLFIYRDTNAPSFSIIEGRDPRYSRSSSTNMGSEKYRLKWSKYESNILNALQRHQDNETLADVTLFCEGKKPLNNVNLVVLKGIRSNLLKAIQRHASLHQDNETFADVTLFL